MFKTVKDQICINRFSEETINILDQSCKAYDMSRSDYLEMLIKNAQTNNAQDNNKPNTNATIPDKRV